MPDQSWARAEEALALARHASDPFSLALSLVFAAELHQRRGEIERALEYANAALALSSEQGFPLYLARAEILRGWVLATQGIHEEGIALIHQGLRAHEATGASLGRPSLLGLLADAYGKAGQEAGLDVLADALTLVGNTGECLDEGNLYRLKGELLLQLAREDGNAFAKADEAQACFQKAIAVARRQGAKSIELKGAVSLGRLWHRQGKNDAARQLLVQVHSSFTEGFDTVDLRLTRKLLEELS